MALKECLHCRSLIDKDSEMCPHCKRPQGFNWKSIIILLILIFILLLIYVFYSK